MEQELLNYAMNCFENQEYDQALEAFVLTYSKGYEQEAILETIYNCYMSANEKTFSQTYESYNDVAYIPYEDCLIDFIPYKDGEYYIFDKEYGVFRGKFSISEIEMAEDRSGEQREFSAIAAVSSWNWSELPQIVKAAAGRKVYMICPDIARCMSFYKLPELLPYATNIRCFRDTDEMKHYFMVHTGEYCPQLFYATQLDRADMVQKFQEIHQYRLTKEGRNIDNVLLTIGIPTHNRGNLVLESMKDLLALPYDAEIEFVISKNGIRYYQEEYKEIEKMTDARIQYMGYDRDLPITKNWQNVVNMAHGKYVLMVSDEDRVIPEAIEHYLKLLHDHPEIGYVRSRTVYQYSYVNKNQIYDRGANAFLEGFLQQNYLSGSIYRKQDFMQLDFNYWDENYKENIFYVYYPHVWWQSLMAYKGAYATDACTLISEGESVLQEENDRLIAEGADGFLSEGENPIASYSTYESRIQQFHGMVALIKEFDELDEETYFKAFRLCVNKTMTLMHLVYKHFDYKRDEFPQWIDKFLDAVEQEMDAAKLSKDRRMKIFEELRIFIGAIEMNVFESLITY